MNTKDEYSPSFSVSNNNSKQCRLYNQKSQGNRPVCWAACVATIVNYIKGTNMSTLRVCNDMGINEGASLWEAYSALNRYGVNYQSLRNVARQRMNLDEIKSSIQRKKPIYVASKTDDSGHAVVAFGYGTAGGRVYINFWNPQLDGNTLSFEYKSTGTIIVCNNKSYVWTYSIS